MSSTKAADILTIVKWINTELNRVKAENGEDTTLYDVFYQLNRTVDTIIKQLKEHIELIKIQMPDFDEHGTAHSEKVLENIEKLLQRKGIENLTLLEAILLRLCCYLHDAGMILPAYFGRFLEMVEQKDYVFHTDKPVTSIKLMLEKPDSGLKSYQDVVSDQKKRLFFCPDNETDYLDFFVHELQKYEEFRSGLSPVKEGVDHATFCQETRQEYLRRTHGERSARYAKNLKGWLLSIQDMNNCAAIEENDCKAVADAAGNICAAHCWNIDEVNKLPHEMHICSKYCPDDEEYLPEMSCNTRYLAMLLRLGDVLHVSNDRTSIIRYAESEPLNDVSDRHWRFKLTGLKYRFFTKSKPIKISYYASFSNPDEYYFLQDYLDWADDELSYYANFLSEAENWTDGKRYQLGLPLRVDRSGINPIGFTPDRDLRFRLEQRKIIELLMGARLYRDEWMCLRELYQNALDACRCMMAEDERNGKTSHPTIEFGLSEEEGRKVLYCRDEGTGMTEYIVKNYLLRIGNSYYHSDDFRRSNAAWKDAVAPISEFGIGLLSCYMIADEIEVITLHYTLGEDKTIRLRMKGSEDYGYFCNATKVQQEQLGAHGTIVKLYLKDKFAADVLDRLPEDPKLWLMINELHIDNHWPTTMEPVHKELFEELLSKSLYSYIHRFLRIPDPRIKVKVTDNSGQHQEIVNIFQCQPSATQIEQLFSYGFSVVDIARKLKHFYGNISIDTTTLSSLATVYPCFAEDCESRTTAYFLLTLPNADFTHITPNRFIQNNLPNNYYINGIPAVCTEPSRKKDQGVYYNFTGKDRPLLTVSRDQINKWPSTIACNTSRALSQLLETIAEQICLHYDGQIQSLPDCFLFQLALSLHTGLSQNSLYTILRYLSVKAFKDMLLYGNPLKQWFEAQECKIKISDIDMRRNFTLLQMLCYQADHIKATEEEIIIRFPEKRPENDLPKIFSHDVIRIDEWCPTYSQYDYVSSFHRFVPAACPQYTDVERLQSCSALADSSSACAPFEWDPILFDTSFTAYSFTDIITSLAGTLQTNAVHNIGRKEHYFTSTNKAHVLYAYINPRSLTKEDDEYTERYKHITKYTQGIKEGWSILFYGYQNSFVIAPGKQDRMDMLKLLPQEVLDRDDGIEYCFTDGTHAFGTKLTE